MIRLFYNDTFKNYFLLMVTLFIEEIIFRLCVGLSIFSWSMLRIFIGINLLSLILAALFSFFGRLASNILTFISALFFTIYSFLQTGFYNYLGVYMSFSSISKIGVVKDFIVDFITSYSIKNVLLFVPLLILGIFYITCDYRIKVLERNDEIDFADKFDSEERKKLNDAMLRKSKKRRWWDSKANALVISAAFAGIYYYTLTFPIMQNDLQLQTNSELFTIPNMPNIVVNQFGYTGYAILDIKSQLFSKIPTLKSSYNKEYKRQEQAESDFMRRIDDTLWLNIAEKERRPNYKTLNNYYMSQEITDKNDFTGFFKDKNLIVIMMESTNNMLINEEYFPNVYKLYKNGWSWENNYSPRTYCSTINSEISGMTSLYTVNNVCTGDVYKSNGYPESIFNLFKNSNYKTSSYHNYTDEFYNRTLIHQNMGSEKYYNVQSLGIPYSNKYNEWPSDKALIEKFLQHTKTEEKYMAWLTTVGASQPYNVSSELGDKHLDLFDDTKYTPDTKRYLSKLKEFDDAIGLLIKGLEDQDKLDNTVIVLYSAHYPNELSDKTLDNYFDYDVNFENNIDKTPFIIYNTEMQGQIFKEYTSYMNLVPTIANLFDLDYDPRLYAGKDIFSKYYENRVIFADGSWKDEKAYYDGTNGKISYYDPNNNYSATDLKTINNTIRDRISMSNLAIKTNYFYDFEEQKNALKIENIEGQSDTEE